MNETVNLLVSAAIPFLILACSVIVAIVLTLWVTGHLPSRRKPLATSDKVQLISDWLPTLRIDAVSDAKIMEGDENSPATWWLTVEETRLVAGVSGEPNLEVRWRNPTKAEVKNIIRQYHAAQADAISKRATTRQHTAQANAGEAGKDQAEAAGGAEVNSAQREAP